MAITGDDVANQAIQAAQAGPPYQYAGDPYSGSSWSDFFSDCSGLVDRIFANLGMKLPGRPTTFDLVTMGQTVDGLANAKPGDLLFFNDNDHVGVYVGNNQMVEDPQTGQNLHQTNVYAQPDEIRRLVPAGDGTGLASATDPNTGTATNVGFWSDLGGLAENSVSAVVPGLSFLTGGKNPITDVTGAIKSVASVLTFIADFFHKLAWLFNVNHFYKLMLYLFGTALVLIGITMAIVGAGKERPAV